MPVISVFSTSPLKPLPDITRKEEGFLAQLINQSIKFEPKDAQSALSSAKKILKTDAFIINSCKALKGFLTHNPKIYDAKVKGRVFAPAKDVKPASPYIFSDTVSFHHRFDWAGNAKYLSKRYFLCTEFIYQGQHTTLYHEFLQETSSLDA